MRAGLHVLRRAPITSVHIAVQVFSRADLTETSAFIFGVFKLITYTRRTYITAFIFESSCRSVDHRPRRNHSQKDIHLLSVHRC